MKKKKNYFNFLKSERKLFYVSKVKTNRPAFTNIPDFWISAQRTFKKAKSMFQGRKIHVEEAVLSYTPSPVTCHNSLTTFSSSLSPLFHSLSLFTLLLFLCVLRSSYHQRFWIQVRGTHHDLLLYLFAFLCPSSTLNFSIPLQRILA